MHEVIQGLIETEGEAKRIVESARQEAEGLISNAQSHAHAALARAAPDTRLEAEKIIAEAVQQAEAEKRRLLDKASLEIRSTIQLDPATREQIVQAVVQCVCGHD